VQSTPGLLCIVYIDSEGVAHLFPVLGHSFRVHLACTHTSAGRSDLRLLSDDAFSVNGLHFNGEMIIS